MLQPTKMKGWIPKNSEPIKSLSSVSISPPQTAGASGNSVPSTPANGGNGGGNGGNSGGFGSTIGGGICVGIGGGVFITNSPAPAVLPGFLLTLLSLGVIV